MVGLSILLESYQKKTTVTTTTKNPQVINKTISIKPSLPPSLLPSISFLDSCYLCKQRIFPGKDIYMYKGDRAFCSVECRCRQIYMDEEDSINVSRQNNKCSFTSTSSSSSTHHHQRKGNKNNRANGFAYKKQLALTVFLIPILPFCFQCNALGLSFYHLVSFYETKRSLQKLC